MQIMQLDHNTPYLPFKCGMKYLAWRLLVIPTITKCHYYCYWDTTVNDSNIFNMYYSLWYVVTLN